MQKPAQPTVDEAAAPSRPLRLASLCLVWSSVLIPLGFLLGGFLTYGGDPGAGIFLVPVGALALWIGVLLVARGVYRQRP